MGASAHFIHLIARRRAEVARVAAGSGNGF